jgi:hypothetical protein
MTSSKIDRSLYGPSLFEVTLGAVLSVLLGAALATLLMVLKPAVVAPEMPKEEERVADAVYFLEGKTDGRSKQWMRKRQMLLEGTPGEIVFTEEELNAWLASGAPAKPVRKAGAAPGAEEPVPEEIITVDVANVRIRDGVFQLGVPAHLNLISFSLPMVFQARGGFARQAEMWTFVPEEVYLGSMPLHRIPGVSDLMARRIVRLDSVPEDAMAAWKKVKTVALDGRQLKLTLE